MSAQPLSVAELTRLILLRTVAARAVRGLTDSQARELATLERRFARQTTEARHA